jgi:hypothetical protein
MEEEMAEKLALVVLLVMLSGCAPGATVSSPTPPGPATNTAQPPAAPTANALVTPTAHASPTPTPALSSMNVHTETFSSPDGKWMAQLTVALPVGGASVGDNYYTRLEIARTDHAVTWVAVDQWSRFGLGYTTPRPLHWSGDGQYLYFTNAPTPDGCAVFANGEDLQQVDLKNGQVKEVVPKVAQVVSLSPDDQTLAYIPSGGTLRLILRSLATGAERQVDLSGEKDAQAGSIVWSPDTQVVILTVAIHPCDPSQWRYSVERIDTPTMALKTLIPNGRRSLRTIGWRGVAMVELEDNAGNQWLIDAVTGGSPLP